SPATIQLEMLREQLVSTTQTHILDNSLSEMWFSNCSDRLTDMWELECSLIHRIKESAAALITEAETDLKNVKGLIDSLRNDPPAQTNFAVRFFDPEIPVELAFMFVPSNLESNHTKSMIDVLQLQSKRLAEMEHELENTRKALTERKTIEKAKGLMMSKFNLTEEDAYKRMRSSAMEQNKKLLEVAQTIIAVSSMF
ncbi:MAG: ANTAR domain-containing response regulator, partial [Methylophilus sp.]